MSGDDRAEFHDEVDTGSVGANSAESDPEEPIPAAESRTLASSRVDSKLLAEGGVFECQCCPGD